MRGEGMDSMTERGSAVVTMSLMAGIAAVACVYATLFQEAYSGFAPIWSDEYVYVANARSFFENTRLHDAYILKETASAVGGFGGHGFAYNLLHGAIAKCVGFHVENLLLTNTALLLLALALIGAQRSLSLTQKSVCILLLLLNLVPVLYTFSCMQEALHLLFGVAAGLLLWRMWAADNPRRCVAIYFALLFVATLFRPSWWLWSIGLLPLARTGKERAIYAAALLGGMLGAWALFHWCAPVPYASFAQKVVRLQDAAAIAQAMYAHFARSVYRYFATEYEYGAAYFVSKYLLVIGTYYALSRGRARKNRLLLAAGVIGLANLLFLFTVFDAFDWRGHRMLAPVMCLLGIVIASERQWTAAAVALICLGALFPSAVRQSEEWIAQRNAVADAFRGSSALAAEFNAIAAVIPDPRLTTVLASRAFFQNNDMHPLLLPVRSTRGYPIRYTFNKYGADLQMHRPGFVDYVLAPEALSLTNASEVLRQPAFHLYRVAGRR